MIKGKIPVSVITGFLGAGKTTFILRLLEQKPNEEYWAILINEFGNISIDTQNMEENSSKENQVFEISGGCICCSSRHYFSENLQQITEIHKPDRIIIEPSGLGGVDSIKQSILQEKTLDLLPTICILDKQSFSNPRIRLNGIFLSQLTVCDILLISKSDLETESMSKKIFPDEITLHYPGKLFYGFTSDSELFIPPVYQISKKKKHHTSPGFTLIENKKQKIEVHQTTYFYNANKCFNLDRLQSAISYEESIIRTKGFLNTINGWILLNTVGDSIEIQPCQSKTTNSLVIFYDDTSSDHLQKFQEQLNSCLI